jgi:hypothetical protein
VGVNSWKGSSVPVWGCRGGEGVHKRTHTRRPDAAPQSSALAAQAAAAGCGAPT